MGKIDNDTLTKRMQKVDKVTRLLGILGRIAILIAIFQMAAMIVLIVSSGELNNMALTQAGGAIENLIFGGLILYMRTAFSEIRNTIQELNS
ncbi:MAG: hypothetical protein P9X24_09820 [Candidatus Hatepunaea meridiana]|nr:hypothetical protein [Candidatus Hatepunaea meridiana]